jgi:type VI protein secretion system component VasK
MLDTKDPSIMATVTLLVTFVLVVGILYLAKPAWVQVVNQTTGKSSISWQLVIAYSATFALVCAIAALLIVSNIHKKSTSQLLTYANQTSSFPIPTMASAYCGSKHQT